MAKEDLLHLLKALVSIWSEYNIAPEELIAPEEPTSHEDLVFGKLPALKLAVLLDEAREAGGEEAIEKITNDGIMLIVLKTIVAICAKIGKPCTNRDDLESFIYVHCAHNLPPLSLHRLIEALANAFEPFVFAEALERSVDEIFKEEE